MFLRFLTYASLAAIAAQAAGLGLLTVRGSVRENGFLVWGNGTVTEGMLVQTGKTGARIRLNSGPEILLAPSSQLRVQTDSVSLESGSVMIRHPGSLAVHAPGLSRGAEGTLLAGPNAANIPSLLLTLSESRPLSQRP